MDKTQYQQMNNLIEKLYKGIEDLTLELRINLNIVKKEYVDIEEVMDFLGYSLTKNIDSQDDKTLYVDNDDYFTSPINRYRLVQDIALKELESIIPHGFLLIASRFFTQTLLMPEYLFIDSYHKATVGDTVDIKQLSKLYGYPKEEIVLYIKNLALKQGITTI